MSDLPRREFWTVAAAIAAVIVLTLLIGWPRAALAETLLPHPQGCPRAAFCGCGAAVEIFGRPVRDLFLAANWFKFPRTQPAPGMVAVRRGHVFVLKQHVAGNVWRVIDHNSGGHKSRLHRRSIAGYQIVNPFASNVAGL